VEILAAVSEPGVYLMWGVILVLLGLALLLLEAFIPSYGILGTCSILAVLAGIGVAFYGDSTYGAILLAASIFAIPIAIALLIKWWPKTPIGRRVLLNTPMGDEVLPDNPLRRTLRELIGKTGKAKSVMLPSGAVTIDGRVIDAVSEGMTIEAGQWVRVIEVRGNRVVVRAIDEAEAQAARRETEEDLLSKPIESLGINPFDETAT
jgi:membrane-bound serine protease (ClpP class)